MQNSSQLIHLHGVCLQSCQEAKAEDWVFEISLGTQQTLFQKKERRVEEEARHGDMRRKDGKRKESILPIFRQKTCILEKNHIVIAKNMS